MRILQSNLFCLIFLTLAGIAGILHGEPRSNPESERIGKLVRQLGDDRYWKRERAGQDLRAIGEKALPAVREAESSSDLKVGTRARAVVRAIMRASGKSKSTGLEMVIVDDGINVVFVSFDDPTEMKNFVDADPSRARALEERLFDFFGSIEHDLGKNRWKIGSNPIYNSQAKLRL